jgi:hypothetical protein
VKAVNASIDPLWTTARNWHNSFDSNLLTFLSEWEKMTLKVKQLHNSHYPGKKKAW